MADVRVFDETGELDCDSGTVLVGGVELELGELLAPYLGETVRLRVIVGLGGGGAATPARPPSTSPPQRFAALRR